MGLERHDSINRCKQCIVTTTPNVPTRMKMRTALADDDAASADPFPTVPLNTQSVGIAVSAVSARSHTLLMCHGCLDLDFRNPNLGKLLPMALLLAVPLPSLPLEDDDLLVLAVAKNLGRDRRSIHCGLPDRYGGPIRREEYLVKGYRGTFLRYEGGNPEACSRLRSKLLTACLENRVHDPPQYVSDRSSLAIKLMRGAKSVKVQAETADGGQRPLYRSGGRVPGCHVDFGWSRKHPELVLSQQRIVSYVEDQLRRLPEPLEEVRLTLDDL